MIELMYITNRTDVAQIAETSGVDRIFVDLERIGKAERQGGMDTVQSCHTVDDVLKVKSALQKSQLLVRVNSIYGGSKKEIEMVIANGADIVMLPYFKTAGEAERFLSYVNGGAKTMLLFETPESVDAVDEILSLKGIDEAFIGLNDLSMGYRKKFMFELLVDGTVEKLCSKFKFYNLPYGFGGIASLGNGGLPAEKIIKEHYRLGSTRAILSRSFCNADKVNHIGKISKMFMNGVKEIREFEKECEIHRAFFNDNTEEVKEIVAKISKGVL